MHQEDMALNTDKQPPLEGAMANNIPRILLAEDDDEMRSLLAWTLRKHGFEVTECSNGVTLLKYLDSLLSGGQSEAFDLILSDVRMPGFTGLEILEGLKDIEDAPPMILITAFGDEETHALAKRLGAAAMLDKPFDIEDLLSLVDDVVLDHLPQGIRRSLSSKKRMKPLKFPLDIVFRHMSPSEPITAFVRKKAAKLNRFQDKIADCQIVIEAPPHHHRHGSPYRVRITLSIPDKEFAVGHDPGETTHHQNPYAAISDSLNALYHQMKTYFDRYKKQKLQQKHRHDLRMEDFNM